MSHESKSAEAPNGDLLDKLTIEVAVVIGRARPMIRELIAMEQNAVLPLDSKLEDPVGLYAGEKLIARGVLEKAANGGDGQLAIRLTEIVQRDALD